mmetsp:Transcript_13146/g.16383  ORF Transcript_13146/g.16383 Transcript_13146/m.16383 type:complete len:373 (+) Transcript_13146:3-1121(+)
MRQSYLDKCNILQPNKCAHPKLNDAVDRLVEAYDVLNDPRERDAYRRKTYGPTANELEEERQLEALQNMLRQLQEGTVVIQGGAPMGTGGPPRLPLPLLGLGGFLGGGRRLLMPAPAEPEDDDGGEGDDVVHIRFGPPRGLMEFLARGDDDDDGDDGDDGDDDDEIPELVPGNTGMGGLGLLQHLFGPPPTRERPEVEEDREGNDEGAEFRAFLDNVFNAGRGAPDGQGLRGIARVPSNDGDQTAETSLRHPRPAPPGGHRLLRVPGTGESGRSDGNNQMDPMERMMRQMVFGPGFGRMPMTPPMIGPGHMPGGAVMPPPNTRPPRQNHEERFAAELGQLEAMGFTDRQRNIEALLITGGNVDAAVGLIVGG